MADLNKEELAKLFGEFDTSHSDWKNKKAAVEAENAKQSELVKRIAAMVAPAKKVRWRGKDLTIVCRPSKDKTTESWFFRGLDDTADDSIVEIG